MTVALVAAGLFGVAVLDLDIDVHVKEAVAQSAADAWSPVGTAPDLDVYYPGTEALKPDEMRIVAL